MKIYIKNIDCPLFLGFVKFELERLNISYTKLNTKAIEVADNLSEKKVQKLNDALLSYDIKIEAEKKSKMVLKIKTYITKYIDNQKLELEMTLPQYIISKLGMNFICLNNTFYQETGMTIEKYYKWRKVKLAKKLLVYYNLTINEISYQLNYKNENDLLQQFKDEIGIIPEPKRYNDQLNSMAC